MASSEARRPAVPARRADAARSMARLVEAARDLIEESGTEVPLDEVARRAGVGNATLYRHFPTRGDLLVAVYADEVTELCRKGAGLLTHPEPGDALFRWTEDFIGHVSAKRALALAATEGPTGRRTELFDRWHEAMRSAAAGLLDRARHAGAVRPDVTVTDLLALAGGVALAATDEAHARRLLGVVRTGVGTGAA
ncbi:TetR family transcriptional regulator [Sphaerisporangium rufum]|uniref:TetR family transcriptional regulator n=1 Tax=Sphaerisporangium rufum TaxID=1381558 RepID=A0A919R7A3_9ACTN|nr:TetR/AcrR family transcriptional regulator [Sphaerisporangium rufum]GII80794.1 TetR family transcriptional regulator [Sphaerisporangium rufum]